MRIPRSSLILPILLVCAAVAPAGAAPAPPPQAAPPNAFLLAVACPTTTQCTAINTGGGTIPAQGGQVTFDPTHPGTPAGVPITSTVPEDQNIAMQALACPSAHQCTATGDVAYQNQPTSADDGFAVTFDPTSQAKPSVVAIPSPTDPDANILTGIACPTTTQCTAVGGGSEVTFNPAAPGSPTPVALDPGYRMRSVACPSASLCVAVGQDVSSNGRLVAFDPANPAGARKATVNTFAPASVSCPSTTRCVGAAGIGVVTFDPGALDAAKPTLSNGTAVSYFEVSCPTTAVCGLAGFGRTFDGQNGQGALFTPDTPAATTPSVIDAVPLGGVGAFACPSASQCTGVDGKGQEVTYDPSAPGTPVPVFVANFPIPARQPSAAAQQSAASSAAAAPSGSAAKITSLLKNGGATLSVNAPSAGTVTTTWFQASSGARAAAKRPSLAHGAVKFSAAGTHKLKVRLTTRGKRLLKKARRVRLTSVATFTPTGGKPVVKKRTFTVKR